VFDDAVVVLTFLGVLGSGLIGGVFFAFSAFIMRALDRLPPRQGIAAMQSINVTVLGPWFIAAFIGTAGVSALLGVVGALDAAKPGGLLRLAGAGFTLIGVLTVTGLTNVPRNTTLMAVDPEDSAAGAVWARYVREWTRWNTARTVAAIAAGASFACALMA
jgi:uncharacterized membrane protein